MYTCAKSFTSKGGKQYSAGSEIDQPTYDKLSLTHKANFNKKTLGQTSNSLSEESKNTPSRYVEDNDNDGIGAGIAGAVIAAEIASEDFGSSDSGSSCDSGSDFGGFGGGDGGGGGAGGDF